MRASHRRTRPVRFALVCLTALGMASAPGCAEPAAEPTHEFAPAPAAALSDAVPSDSAGAFPDHWPAAFGFGRTATPAEIAALDIDVRPDGAGLPPGRGTVAEGATVYAAACAVCHGPTGREGPYDRLVGGDSTWTGPLTIGNYWPYATTLYDYVRRAMPQTAPGSLAPDDVYALVAFLLHANGLVGEDAVLTAETLPRVVMPARGRFVPDDRRGGPEVR